MIEAVLIDLDGTLLAVDMDDFIPRYLRLMQQEAVRQGLIEAGHNLPEDVLYCTAKMLESDDLTQTNQDVFMRHFFINPYYNAKKQQVLTFFDDYYTRVFPTLRQYTAQLPQAGELIARLRTWEKPIVLATNPLFPLRAIRCRVEWAGLDPEDFTLLTAYEQMHAAKPKLAYYEEICAMHRFDPARCIMIGNDSYEDVAPAALGMRTYLLEDHVLRKKGEPLRPTWQGTMRAFIETIIPQLAVEA